MKEIQRTSIVNILTITLDKIEIAILRLKLVQIPQRDKKVTISIDIQIQCSLDKNSCKKTIKQRY